MKERLKNIMPPEFISPSPGFVQAMNSIGLYWWYWDGINEELYLSKDLMKLLGFNVDEYDPGNVKLSKRIHRDDIRTNIEHFNLLLKGEIEVYEMEYRIRVDDEWVWYYNRGTAVYKDEDGKALIVGGISMELSKRYSRILARVEEGKKFEFVFRNTEIPILVTQLSAKGDPVRIVEANSACCALLHCDVDDLIGVNPYDLLNGPFFTENEDLREVFESKKTFSYELPIIFGDEEKIYAFNSYPYNYANENFLITVINDKTESQRVKNDLKASESALKKSEKIYRMLIQAADDRIGLFQSDGTPVIVNNAFAEVLGYTVEEYLELEDMENIHPDDRERLNALQAQLYEKGYVSIEYRALHKDGHSLDMASKSVLIQDSDLEQDFILFIIRDISEKKDFELELIRAKEKAIESDMLKSAFLANMSHEIRTPMNSIIGFSNLLSDPELDEHSRQEYVNRINRNSEQLLTLITDIIDLAKIESNQLSVNYSRVILSSLFSELMIFGQLQLEQKNKAGISLHYEPDPKFPHIEIETDLVRVTQILQNLINNAVKFTSAGEIKVGYRILEKDRVQFYVQDTGIGIDNKNFEVIFDQFRQVDGSNTRKFGGTGLGLAICKHLTELLGGKIWVESVLEKGSIFFLELPLVSGFDLHQPREHHKAGDKSEKKEITVLMVDDDPDNLLLTTTLLRSEGIQVITADSGYRALEILELETLPDVVMLDLQMPVLNGFHTMRIIKEEYPELKVIAQSAYALQGDRENTLDAGFDEYISKPFSRQGLLNKVRKVTSF